MNHYWSGNKCVSFIKTQLYEEFLQNLKIIPKGRDALFTITILGSIINISFWANILKPLSKLKRLRLSFN